MTDTQYQRHVSVSKPFSKDPVCQDGGMFPSGCKYYHILSEAFSIIFFVAKIKKINFLSVERFFFNGTDGLCSPELITRTVKPSELILKDNL